MTGKPQESVSGLNIEDLPSSERQQLRNKTPSAEARALGLGGEATANWDMPKLTILPNEKMLRKGNAGIRLGKDRESHKFSGFGGMPSNGRCAAIDIVAGNMGFEAKRSSRPCNPDFKMDAARIYISQKSNVDGYFDLVPGTVGRTTMKDPRSTVALKADTIRIIGRENIKLVTRTDDYNSQGGKLSNLYKGNFGIDLIGCNDDADMQPLVKGDNLRECLAAIVNTIDAITVILQNFLQYDSEFKKAVQSHTHMSPFYGVKTAPDFEATLKTGVKTAIASALNVDAPLMVDYPMEVAAILNDYLALSEDGKNTAAILGDKYILSKYNSTN